MKGKDIELGKIYAIGSGRYLDHRMLITAVEKREVQSWANSWRPEKIMRMSAVGQVVLVETDEAGNVTEVELSGLERVETLQRVQYRIADDLDELKKKLQAEVESTRAQRAEREDKQRRLGVAVGELNKRLGLNIYASPWDTKTTLYLKDLEAIVAALPATEPEVER